MSVRALLSVVLRTDVVVRDPLTTYIDSSVRVEAGVTLEPNVHLRGTTVVGKGSRVGPNVVLENAQVGEKCALESCTVRESTLGNGVEVGPYSTIRPGCYIGENSHIGTHAELKNARLGRNVAVGHVSYLGDCEVGDNANIGAGAISCNYDGVEKHQTTIGDNAFIGSDTLLIAPVSVGNNARTGAGALVNKDVPDNSIALGMPARIRSFSARQQNIGG